MKVVSEHVLTSFVPSAFVHPHLFVSPYDEGRSKRAIYRNTKSLLVDVDYAEIDETNKLAVHYNNGGMYKSGDTIGIASNSYCVLQALLDSGHRIIIRRDDGVSTILNELD